MTSVGNTLTAEATNRSAVRAERERSSAESAGDAAAFFGFDRMVDRLRRASATNVMHGSTDVSPNLMFEPASTAEAPGGRSRLASETASDANAAAAKQAVPGETFGSHRESVPEVGRSRSHDSGQTFFVTDGANRPGGHDGGAMNSAVPSATVDGSDAFARSGPDRIAMQKSVDDRSATARAPEFEPARVAVAGAGPGDAVVSVSSVGGTSPRTGVAQQVGELLGATRPGTAEAARGGSGPSPFGDGANAKNQTSESATSRTGAERPRTSESRSAPDTKATADRATFEQLVHAMRIRGGERVSSARLHLMPPELGRIRVDVRVEGAQIEIRVLTQNDAARDAVAHRAAQLSAALEEQGLRVARFDVDTHVPNQHGAQDPALNDGQTGAFDPSGDRRGGYSASTWADMDSFDPSAQPFGVSQVAGIRLYDSDLMQTAFDWSVATELRLDITV